MIKKIFFIFFVAIISYYAGSKEIKLEDIKIFFEEKNIKKVFNKTINKTAEFAKEKNLDKKTEGIVEDIKNKIKNY